MRTRSSLRKRLATGLAIGLTALSLLVPSLAAPPVALADSASQSDPAWDFGRGGMESPGMPACYMPAPDITRRRPYNLNRPSCLPHQVG